MNFETEWPSIILVVLVAGVLLHWRYRRTRTYGRLHWVLVLLVAGVCAFPILASIAALVQFAGQP